MSDGYVQVAGDGAGKKIDNAELTRADGTVVERQRVVLADDTNPTQQAIVRDGALVVTLGFRPHRMLEMLLLETMEQSGYLLSMTERYSGNRRGPTAELR